MKYFLIILIIFYGILHADIPEGYYDGTEGLTGDELKTALYNIIKDHIEFPYTSTNTDVWDILKVTDADPVYPDSVILIYTGWKKNGELEFNNGNGWNREHVWAKSHGDFGTAMGPGTDVHHLRPSDISVNSERGNKDFDNGGTEYIDPDGATGCYTTTLTWEPRTEVKGDVARMIFYMAVRYEGENDEPDLEMVDYVPSAPNSEPFHGKLSTLLEWHLEDPVDDWEENRNDIIYDDYQNNRNPFIDIPEFAELIWGEITLINIPGDYPTIQEGINASSNGDTILVQPGTYVENINFDGKNIIIGSLFLTTQDTTYISQTIIDGNQDDTVVRFESGEDSTSVICGFYITNGYGDPSGGGIMCDDSSPSLEYVTITGNSAGSGGGIWCWDNSNPILEDVIITGNSASNGGGILCDDNSSPYLENVIISGNSADGYAGGGIYCVSNSSPCLTNVSIIENSSDNGGGIYCTLYSNPIISNSIISNNQAEINGGGIYCSLDSNLNLSNSTISDNSANYSGGGICIIESSPEIKQSIIEGNSAYDGGGINCENNSNPIISNNKITYNAAVVSGGGIYCYNESVSNITNNEFCYNDALVGGGISIFAADPSIINNNFHHNEAVNGGGIHLSVSDCAIVNNTASNNIAATVGGGIYISNISSSVIINTILWGNAANTSGNEIYISHYDCEPDFYYCDIQGGLNAFGYGPGASFNGVYENNIDSDPLFFGTGAHPYSLLDDSPCINAGTPDTTGLSLPEFDLAGNPRIFGNRIDMGAYENQIVICEGDDNLASNIIKLFNYPNPFNPTTTIYFTTEHTESTELTIYNVKGQKIKSFSNLQIDKSPNQQIIWNGRDQNNRPVSSGVYFYRLCLPSDSSGKSGNYSELRKMILLK